MIEEKIRSRADEEERLLQKISSHSITTTKDIIPEEIQRVYLSPIEVKKVLDNKDQTIRELEDEKRFLRGLATIGIVANTYIHETKASAHHIKIHLQEAQEALEHDTDIPGTLEQIKIAIGDSITLNSWFTVTLGSIIKDKRDRKLCNLMDLVTSYIDRWTKVTEGKNIRYRYTPQNISFKCFPYEIESILTNLITNSIASFNISKTEGPEISIDIDLAPDHDGILISYTDNGRGLSRKYKDDPEKILKAFETDKETTNGEKTGTGMGMWIVNSIVNDYKGNLDLSKNKTSDTGFHAQIYLKGRIIEEKGD